MSLVNPLNLFKMKNKILQTCLQGNYRDSLGEFNHISYGVFGAKRVKWMTSIVVHNIVFTIVNLVQNPRQGVPDVAILSHLR